MSARGPTARGLATYAPKVTRDEGVAAGRVTRVVGALALVAASFVAAGLAAGASSAPHLLTLSELPGPWRVAGSSTSTSESGSCPAVHNALFNNHTVRIQTFTQGPALPSLTEAVVTGAHLKRAWRAFRSASRACTAPRVKIAGKWTTLHPSAITPPSIGRARAGISYSFTRSGVALVVDSIEVLSARAITTVDYAALATPSPTIVAAYATAAYHRLSGVSPRVPSDLTITTAPVEVAHTSDGSVAYRSIGAGPPIVLVMGYAAPMEVWDPRFVDALAQGHRVVVFDNAGVGETSAVRGPLSIQKMADQTAALIATLRLGRCVVVGWSMGGMVAQALAVTHPGEVRALVLMATFPGTGPIERTPQDVVKALTDPKARLAPYTLFPKDQRAAYGAFEIALSGYPPTPAVPAALEAAQRNAILEWWSGRVPAARRVGTIHVPTLVADGRADLVDPSANSSALARLIPGARLVWYPDAGHAFFSQRWLAVSTGVAALVGRAR